MSGSGWRAARIVLVALAFGFIAAVPLLDWIGMDGKRTEALEVTRLGLGALRRGEPPGDHLASRIFALQPLRPGRRLGPLLNTPERGCLLLVLDLGAFVIADRDLPAFVRPERFAASDEEARWFIVRMRGARAEPDLAAAVRALDADPGAPGAEATRFCMEDPEVAALLAEVMALSGALRTRAGAVLAERLGADRVVALTRDVEARERCFRTHLDPDPRPDQPWVFPALRACLDRHPMSGPPS